MTSNLARETLNRSSNLVDFTSDVCYKHMKRADHCQVPENNYAYGTSSCDQLDINLACIFYNLIKRKVHLETWLEGSWVDRVQGQISL